MPMPPTDATDVSALPTAAPGMREAIGALAPTRPVRVEWDRSAAPTLRPIRIAVVVPCYNRRADAEAVLADLAAVETGIELDGAMRAIDLRVLLVDNASDQPLSTITGPWEGKLPGLGGLALEHLRSDTNTGGSGGYNAGMARVLSWWKDGATDDDPWDPDYVWLVDSDARVAPTTLSRLLDVLEGNEAIVAAGSVICDPLTGQAFELGGNQNPLTGHFEPMVLGGAGVTGSRGGLVDCDYVAACCALVRTDAIRATGLFPDRFLNADDVEWFIRMKQRTGGRVVGVPASVAMHPRFDRFPTWTRYYSCRNAFGPLEAVGAGKYGRAVRAYRESLRAVQQAINGRTDLARLHVRGLADAAAKRTIGPAPEGTIALMPTRPWSALADDLRRVLGDRAASATLYVLNDLQLPAPAARAMHAQLATLDLSRPWPTPRREAGMVSSLARAACRFVLGPRATVAIAPARGRPSSWHAGRLVVQVNAQGYVLHRPRRLHTAWNAARTIAACLWHSARVTFREPEYAELPTAPQGPAVRPDSAVGPALAGAPRRMTIATVVLSYNRWDALRRTLAALMIDPAAARGVVVVDNASTDGTPERVRAEFPGVRLIVLDQNIGVAAFNRGVAETESEFVLILDDDATVSPRALSAAASMLERRPDLAAIALHPRHPQTGRSEWPFAHESATSDNWPVMGCANLVRRADWDAVGGYEGAFFLYRNDTDLALKLLAAGRGVHFDPSLVALHDTPAGAGGRKSTRWHTLATRNWVWLARRHARGSLALAAALLGWAWAHRLAGLSPSRQWASLRGGFSGLFSPPPPLPQGLDRPDGTHLLRLLNLRFGTGRRE
ncbi:MAG: glycosyltransferase [Phycisphaeraceae bacterium]|nr:glycosyltransferase [Phycisphaeraceae bacterium]